MKKFLGPGGPIGPEVRLGLQPAHRPPLTGSSAVVSEPAACNDNTGILHLAELVPVVRQRLGISDAFGDDLILASLRAISAHTTDRDRWRAAFESRLGLWLSTQGRELGRALSTLVSLLPPPRN